MLPSSIQRASHSARKHIELSSGAGNSFSHFFAGPRIKLSRGWDVFPIQYRAALAPGPSSARDHCTGTRARPSLKPRDFVRPALWSNTAKIHKLCIWCAEFHDEHPPFGGGGLREQGLEQSPKLALCTTLHCRRRLFQILRSGKRRIIQYGRKATLCSRQLL